VRRVHRGGGADRDGVAGVQLGAVVEEVAVDRVRDADGDLQRGRRRMGCGEG